MRAGERSILVAIRLARGTEATDPGVMTKPGALLALAAILSGCGGPDFTTAATAQEASRGAAGAPEAALAPESGGQPAAAPDGDSGAPRMVGTGGRSGTGGNEAAGGAVGTAGGVPAAGGASVGAGGKSLGAGGADPVSAGGRVGTGGIPFIGLGSGGAASGASTGGFVTITPSMGGAGGAVSCDPAVRCAAGHCGTIECADGATIDCSKLVICGVQEYCAGSGADSVCSSYFTGLGCNGYGSGPVHVCLTQSGQVSGCNDCQMPPTGRAGCIETMPGTWRCTNFVTNP